MLICPEAAAPRTTSQRCRLTAERFGSYYFARQVDRCQALLAPGELLVGFFFDKEIVTLIEFFFEVSPVLGPRPAQNVQQNESSMSGSFSEE
jgi:hypothetical protein